LIDSSNHHRIGVRAADHESDNDQIIRILVLAFGWLFRDGKSNKLNSVLWWDAPG